MGKVNPSIYSHVELWSCVCPRLPDASSSLVSLVRGTAGCRESTMSQIPQSLTGSESTPVEHQSQSWKCISLHWLTPVRHRTKLSSTSGTIALKGRNNGMLIWGQVNVFIRTILLLLPRFHIRKMILKHRTKVMHIFSGLYLENGTW